MSQYFTVSTPAGRVALAHAQATNQPLVFTHLAVGTGLNNASYDPTDQQTALMGEVCRVPVKSVSIDPVNNTWVCVAGEIPTSMGGWIVRELATVAADGTIVTISKTAECTKPLPTSGSGFPLGIEVVFQYAFTAAVSLVVPDSTAASEEFVRGTLADHVAAIDPHGNYLRRNERARLHFLSRR